MTFSANFGKIKLTDPVKLLIFKGEKTIVVDRKIFLIVIVLALLVIGLFLIISLIKKIANKSKKTGCLSTPPKDSPYICVGYVKGSSLLDDGKCGWLDIESEYGETQTIALDFDKKTPNPFFIPLKIAKYRITYRTKSKAAMLADGVLTTINENSGAMGAFANAVYDAGVGAGQLSSIVVDANADFVMKLKCTCNGFEKNCEII